MGGHGAKRGGWGGVAAVVWIVSAVAVLGLMVPRTGAHTPPHPLSNFKPPRIELDPNVTVSVGPTLLMSSGEWVTVTWTGIDSWSDPNAFVAAFSPGTALDDPARITEVAPVKYQYINAGEPLPTRESGGDGNEDDFSDGLSDGAAGAMGGTVPQALRFRLLNLRDEEGYRFGMFKGGISNPVLVASTEEVVTFAQPFEVLHVHLALTDDPTSMRVSWVTGGASRAPAVSLRLVPVDSDEPRGSWQVVHADTSTYVREDMCGAPATTKGFHDPGLQHTAVLTGLLPGRLYEYQAGDSDAEEWAASSFFRAPPLPLSARARATKDPPGLSDGRHREGLPGDARDSYDSSGDTTASAEDEKAGFGKEDRAWEWGPEVVKVGVFGDMGTAEADGSMDAGHSEELPSLKTVAILRDQLGVGVRYGAEPKTGMGDEHIVTPNLELVVHIGDLSYARGYDSQWDEYLDQISPVSSRVPWMVSVGNHERDFPTTSASPARKHLSYFTGEDSGGDCGVPTAFRFLMPGLAGDPLADAPWYSFDFGPIHFTMMSTEHDFTPGSVQHDFLKADLSQVDRSKTPWVVFTGHRPMYVNSGGPGASACEGSGGDSGHEEHCANDQPVAALLRSSLEKILVDNKVDLALYGHHHSYQRTCKVIDEVCVGTSSRGPGGMINDGGGQYLAPVHVIVGMAGQGLSQNMVEPPPSWIEYATDREYGLGIIVADRSALKLSFIHDSDGEVGDVVWLTRPSDETSRTSLTGGHGKDRAHLEYDVQANLDAATSKAFRKELRTGAQVRSKRARF